LECVICSFLILLRHTVISFAVFLSHDALTSVMCASTEFAVKCNDPASVLYLPFYRLLCCLPRQQLVVVVVVVVVLDLYSAMSRVRGESALL